MEVTHSEVPGQKASATTQQEQRERPPSARGCRARPTQGTACSGSGAQAVRTAWRLGKDGTRLPNPATPSQ